jgi:hypothetical protein
MAIIIYTNPTIGYPGFSVTRPYGDLFTYQRREIVLTDYDQNPTQKNPRRLNQSDAYISPIGPIFTGVYDEKWKQQWKDLQVASSYSTPAGVETYGLAAKDTQAGTLYTNKTGASVAQGVGNFAVRGALAFSGFPSLTPFSAKLFDQIGGDLPTYSTTPIQTKNNKYLGTSLPYLDFRARKTTIGRFLKQAGTAIIAGTGYGQAAAFGVISPNANTPDVDIISLIDRRYDGASAALRGSGFASAIAISNTTTGPYTLFNLDSIYGWGQQDDPYAIRNDYTLRSSIAKSVDTAKNIYRKTLAFTEAAIPFRGDRVNVIDFKKRTWNSIYQWVDSDIKIKNEKLDKFRKWTANAAKTLGVNPYGSTKDFIKFFFTGPGLFAGGNPNNEDYALVFRAILTSFTDQFSPSWSAINMIGRADPNYQYGGVSRMLQIEMN